MDQPIRGNYKILKSVLRIHDIMESRLWLMDPDPDPVVFVIDLQDANKKLFLFSKFFCWLLFEGTFISFFKDKK
jgi:hypothetical protein